MTKPRPAAPADTAARAERGGRLLRTEAAALIPLLRALPPTALDADTVLPGWTVRDVLAHCAAALGMAASGTLHDFTPESNERDVAIRRAWPLADVVDELEAAYAGGAAAIDAAGGRLDALALGEWVHGGDVRGALGMADAYASDGLTDALMLLTERSRTREVPATEVTLVRFDDPHSEIGRLRLGPADGPVTAELRTDAGTLFRLCAGRNPDAQRYTLAGAKAAEYLIFN